MPCSQPGPARTVTVPPYQAPPSAPSNIWVVSCTKTGTHKTRCTIAWSRVPNATRYRVESLEPDGSWTTWYVGSGTSCTTPTLYCGDYPTSGPFTVRVRAENEAGASPWTQRTLYTEPCPEPKPPSPPTNVRAMWTCIAVDKVRFWLFWDPVPNAEYYEVRHPIDGLLGRTTKTQFDHTVQSRYWCSGAGAAYTFQVRACNSAGCSSSVSIRVPSSGYIKCGQC